MTWETPQAISTTIAAMPSVDVDAAGRSRVVWRRGTALETRTIDSDGTLGSVDVLDATVSAVAPAIAVADDGAAVLAWVDGSAVEAVRLEPDGSPNTIRVLQSGLGPISVKVAIDSTGLATVVWYDSSGQTTYFRQLLADGTAGGAAQQVEAVNTLSAYDVVTITDDSFLVVYSLYDYYGGTAKFRVIKIDGGSIAVGPSDVSANATLNLDAVALASAPSGMVSAIYEIDDVIKTVQIDDGVPGTTYTLDTMGSPAYQPDLFMDIDVDSTGIATAAFTRYDGSGLRWLRIAADGTPGSIEFLTVDTVDDIQCEVSPDGVSEIVWRDAFGELWSAQIAADETVTGPESVDSPVTTSPNLREASV